MIVLGIDVGTSSTKGVLVDGDGTVLGTGVRHHRVDRPAPGHVEMDAEVWWAEFVAIARELAGGRAVDAVGVSGMGPCVVVADERGKPLRPAILYGVDTRATEQIARLNAQLGADEVLRRCGSLLSTQAVGPKLAWLADHEPDTATAARRLFMPSSLLAHRLTGQYVLDHHSASQSVPLYDSLAMDWYRPWAELIAPRLELPPLRWPGEQAGTVSAAAAAETGLPPGIPVLTGTIDAWSEAVSVGAHRVGDLMLMYGTTMFLICTVAERLLVPELWSTVGAFPGSRTLAGGMASSGAVTEWVRELTGAPPHAEILAEARASGPGARGLLMLPYFAGERTPIADPAARGVLVGLTLAHGRGDLYRAALEATALGVRHNVEALRAAGAPVERVVAVGGGVEGGLWTRIVSDVTGLVQHVPATTVGASYGAAYLATRLLADVDIDRWNPIHETVTPDEAAAPTYDQLYHDYRELYTATADIVHRL